MFSNYYKLIVDGKGYRPDMIVIRLCLSILSFLFYLIISFRNFLYDRNLLPIKKVNVPVICVGNITTGGTGKTPFIIFLAKQLFSRKIKCVIISRGYKRLSKNTEIVSDYSEILSNVNSAGDEPLMLAMNLTGIPVIVDQDRYKAAQMAVRSFNPQIILMDDGFQHRRFFRNKDIVIIDGLNPFGNNRILPRGNLREPDKSLMRADHIIINKMNQCPNKEEVLSKIQKFNKNILITNYSPVKLTGNSDSDSHSVDLLKGKKAVLFSTIGNPQSFYQTIEEIGCDILIHHRYRDHYLLTDYDINFINSNSLHISADVIVTTEKDGVKLDMHKLFKLPLFICKMEIVPDFDINDFINNLELNSG